MPISNSPHNSTEKLTIKEYYFLTYINIRRQLHNLPPIFFKIVKFQNFTFLDLIFTQILRGVRSY